MFSFEKSHTGVVSALIDALSHLRLNHLGSFLERGFSIDKAKQFWGSDDVQREPGKIVNLNLIEPQLLGLSREHINYSMKKKKSRKILAIMDAEHDKYKAADAAIFAKVSRIVKQ